MDHGCAGSHFFDFFTVARFAAGRKVFRSQTSKARSKESVSSSSPSPLEIFRTAAFSSSRLISPSPLASAMATSLVATASEFSLLSRLPSACESSPTVTLPDWSLSALIRVWGCGESQGWG